jgi:hypothetical protein
MNSVFVIKEIIPCNSEPVNLDNLVQILNQSPISPTTKRNSTSHGFLRINSEISSDGFTRYFFGYYSYYKTEYVKTVKEKNLLKNTEIKDKVTKNIEYICLEATSGNCEKRHFIAFKVLTSDLNLKKEFEEHFNQIFAAKHELKKIKPNSFLFFFLKCITSDNGTSLYDHIIPNNTMIKNGDIGINDTIDPNTHLISYKCIRHYYSPFTDAGSIADWFF